jgi:putative transposase
VNRSFKRRLHPNASQESVLDGWRRQCCSLGNAALEQRIIAWTSQRKAVTRFDQTAQLTELRAADPAWAAVPVEVQRSALRRVDLAFQAFFRRCRSGDTPGFPRFRSQRRYDSFALGAVRIKKDRVHVPKLGHVKMNLHRPIEGTIKNAIVRRDASGKWWITFQCDLGDAPPKVPIRSVVGIDLGLEKLATLSTGKKIKNPRCFRRSEAKLADRQRALSRKKKGSRNRESARVLVAKAHATIKNQRLDHARKEVKKIVDRYDLVVYEDLSVRALARGILSKSFHDAAWGLLLRCIASKAEEAGKHTRPTETRLSSQVCCRCGELVPKTLAERTHRCPHCGLTIDRDHNSAIVIRSRGQRDLELERSGVEGEASYLEARPVPN